MKIYTKTGDKGETGLIGGKRVPKGHPRIEAYGAVDELNAVVGMARSLWKSKEDDLQKILHDVQEDLHVLGGDLAAPDDSMKGLPRVSDEHVERLEKGIDGAEKELEPLKSFILPGGDPAAAALHLARTVCRRAERRVIVLCETEEVREVVVRYLNRLSDLLFVLARLANYRAGVKDVPWLGRKK